jgi:putative oxidoreductase
MLASIFVVQGLETLRHPEVVAPRAERVVKQMSGTVPALPAEPEQAVRLNGAIQLAAGTMLGLGWFPRLSALALAGTLVPTTFAGHPFWEEKDPAARKQQQIHFLKNVTMLGGLLVAAVDTDGSPSLAWRRRRAARAARVGIGPAAQAVAGSARVAGDGLGHAALTGGDGLGHAAVTVGDVLAAELPRVMSAARVAGGKLSDAAQTAASTAGDQLPGLAQTVSDAAQTAAGSARTAADKVVQAVEASRERARQYAAA